MPRALANIGEAYFHLHERSPAAADRWLLGIHEAIQSLRTLPQRRPLAPERALAEEEIRQLVFGTYRILFSIEGTTVGVLHVRHVARGALRPEDL